VRGRYRLVGLLLAGSALACAGSDLWPGGVDAPETQLTVEVWSGFSQRPAASGGEAERVQVVLDLTASMRAASPGGPPRYAAARSAALRLATALDRETALGVRALGITEGEDDCADAITLESGSRTADLSSLAPQLARLQPTSESSLADALQQLAEELGGARQGTRVVVFSDLGSECGGDLCAAADSLVGGGARLDLVLLADVSVPLCLESLSPAGAPRAAELDRLPSAAPFRVHTHEVGSSAGGELIARGRSDGSPTNVPPGRATVVLEMSPPAVIGPLVLEQGTHTRVRVLDFPTLEPPTREWSWDVEPGAVVD
jgi:hypothetical protein